MRTSTKIIVISLIAIFIGLLAWFITILSIKVRDNPLRTYGYEGYVEKIESDNVSTTVYLESIKKPIVIKDYPVALEIGHEYSIVLDWQLRLLSVTFISDNKTAK